MKCCLLTPSKNSFPTDVGLLILRIGLGLMMAFSHGWGKFVQFFTTEGPIQWADPLGFGPGTSLFLAAGTEFVCSLLLIAGLLTRFATIPLIITMLVAALIVHADDPFKKQEFALLYLVPYVLLLLSGPGRFSLDAMLMTKCKTTPASDAETPNAAS